jgi:hypothetical protein
MDAGREQTSAYSGSRTMSSNQDPPNDQGKSLIDELDDESVRKAISDAAKAARERANALGLPQAVFVNGRWCKKYPDGRIAPLSESEDDVG